MRRGWWTRRPLLACYAPLGDPDCPVNLLEIYAENGVDIVEVGIPSTNPYLDGPAVADSMRRVLSWGNPQHRIREQIEAQAQFASRCRLVLMGYHDMPYRWAEDLARRKLIHGLIMADATPENEPVGLDAWLAGSGMERIGFVNARMDTALIQDAIQAGGYVMLQAHDGPTGVRGHLDEHNAHKLTKLRHLKVELPILLGFGIGTAEQAAAAMGMGADGVVVGSACVAAARQGAESLRALVRSVRSAIDSAAAG
jgi:tryptophan synthase alpha chain